MKRDDFSPDAQNVTPTTTPYNSAAARWADVERAERQRQQQRLVVAGMVVLGALVALLLAAFAVGQASPQRYRATAPVPSAPVAADKDAIVAFEGTGIEIVRATNDGSIVYARMRTESGSPYWVQYVSERRNASVTTESDSALIGKDATVHSTVHAVPLRKVSVPSWFSVVRDGTEKARFTSVIVNEKCASGETTASLAVCREHSASAAGKRRCGMVSERLDACYQGDIAPVAWALIGEHVWVVAHREAPTDAYMLLGVSLHDAPLY